MSVNMLRVFILILFITCVSIHALPVDEFELRILHSNDMHARFEETSELSSICTAKQSKAGKCFGGFARIATLIRQARKSSDNTLFLNAGDTYQGTILFTVHKWKIVSKFLNILNPDAISLGNHEFDNGVAGLVDFINNATYPIVTSNLDLSQEPTLQKSKLLNSTILEVKGKKIGVIGYLTPDTKNIAMTDNVIFRDEIESIREEVKRLKEQNINIFIALGHSGFDMDKKIAEEIDDIDLVIGGHTNTFLYSGKEPSSETPDGLYPTEIIQKNGRKVYVVQAYAYTKYLGNLTIKFDKDGEIKSILGNPILVDSKIEQAKDVLDELDKNWLPAVEGMKKEVVGRTKVLLDGDFKVCRRKECSMGNFIADAMIDYNSKQFAHKDGWSDTAIALFNSGSIRSSITRDNEDKITRADVLQVLPFGNMLMKSSMTGSDILEVLEFSVRDLTPNPNDTSNLNGGFLQFSGIQVIYDLSKEKGSRVVSAKIRCASCNVPSFGNLVKNNTYNVLVNDFLMSGGDNYAMLKKLKANNEGVTINDVVVEYLKKETPVHYGTEWRISFVNLDNKNNDNTNNTVNENNVGDNVVTAGDQIPTLNSASSLHPLTIFILLPLIKLITF
ncbi:protein 5NUC-like [Leptopilina heterotoma]|uniref:protein 5NUC-like n=1 Tax=Leptopilina heterotoma TaxID=63436 RepID=UPI001CA90853|nr:protein 5NUC-like [Leptopilina heterotoma]